MKTRYALAVLTLGLSTAAMSQENDDMYFNSKDRMKLNAENEIALTKRYGQEDLNAVKTNPVNPSDSYSGRGINPEFNSQIKNGTSVVQNNPDYFLTGYVPKNVNSTLYSGNTGAYSSPYYGNCNCGTGGYGYNGMNSMYSPYSSMYSPYGMGMYSPYSSMYGMGMYSPYSSMYGMGMGYGMGSMYGMGMSYGMGMGGYGMGSMYGMFSMSYGMGSMYSPYGYSPYGYYGYGSGYSYGVAGDSRVVTNGNHPSRSSSLNNMYVDHSRSTGSGTTAGTSAGRGMSGGRMGSSQPDYYDRGWRSNASNFTSDGMNGNSGRSSWGNSGNTGWGNNSSSWDNGGRRQSVDSWGGGGGSRGGFSGGGGVSGGGGGSSGGSHSRGRN